MKNKTVHRIVWWCAVFLGASIPMLARLMVYLSNNTSDGFEISECVFFGLTMSITNLTAVGNLEIKEKLVVNLVSSLLSLILAILLAMTMTDSNHNVKYDETTVHHIFHFFIIGLVIASTYISYDVNERIFLYNEKLKRNKNR